LDNRPIGVFDSGLGGLTAVKRLCEVLPSEKIIYLGDTGRVPYGSRSKETIISYTRDDVKFLSSFDVKALIVACNTISAAALDTVSKETPVKMLGVVDSAVVAAGAATKNNRIGVIGTVATVKSGIYEAKLNALSTEIEIFSQPCPLLVPLVENGRINKGDVVTETVLREYLAPLQAAGIDVLIMGCTHYPLLEPMIKDILGDEVTLIDSGRATAEYAKKWLNGLGLSSSGREGSVEFYVTDSTSGFEDTASMFLGHDIHGQVKQVSLGAKA